MTFPTTMPTASLEAKRVTIDKDKRGLKLWKPEDIIVIGITNDLGIKETFALPLAEAIEWAMSIVTLATESPNKSPRPPEASGYIMGL